MLYRIGREMPALSRAASGRRYQAERFSCRALYPVSTTRLSSVDEAETMTEKQLKTADELKRIIMQEIRKNPNCSSVQAVEIMPAPEQSAPHPNWSVSMWTLEGEPSAPPCADDIERDIQSKFALA
jgi:hypothetical protein